MRKVFTPAVAIRNVVAFSFASLAALMALFSLLTERPANASGRGGDKPKVANINQVNFGAMDLEDEDAEESKAGAEGIQRRGFSIQAIRRAAKKGETKTEQQNEVRVTAPTGQFWVSIPSAILGESLAAYFDLRDAASVARVDKLASSAIRWRRRRTTHAIIDRSYLGTSAWSENAPYRRLLQDGNNVRLFPNLISLKFEKEGVAEILVPRDFDVCDLLVIANAYPGLKELHLGYVSFFSEHSRLCRLLPQLESLSCLHFGYTDKQLAIVSSLNGAKELRELKLMAVRYDTYGSDNSAVCTALASHLKLRVLIIPTLIMKQKDIEILADLKELTHLEFRSEDNWEKGELDRVLGEVFRSFSKLISLNVQSVYAESNELEDEHKLSKQTLEDLSKLQHLKELVLPGIEITPGMISKLPVGYPHEPLTR